VRVAGELVTLREYELPDAGAVPEWAADPRVTRYLTWGPGEVSSAEKFVRQAVASAAEQPRQVFEVAVEENQSGLVVGSVRLSVRHWLNRRADVGYVLRHDRWGRGYGTEATGLLMGFGFDFGMHRIEAMCHPDNHGSVRVMEKVGMQYEGRLRDVHRVGGEWCDALLYAKLSDR
jgi:RimJ/RimL family protein N-acetyltransferase